jgi:hypothetical protein
MLKMSPSIDKPVSEEKTGSKTELGFITGFREFIRAHFSFPNTPVGQINQAINRLNGLSNKVAACASCEDPEYPYYSAKYGELKAEVFGRISNTRGDTRKYFEEMYQLVVDSEKAWPRKEDSSDY